MDPTTATFLASLAAGLGPALFSAFSKVVEKGVIDPALEKGTEPLQKWLTRGYDRAKDDAVLQAALTAALDDLKYDSLTDEAERVVADWKLANLDDPACDLLATMVIKNVTFDPAALPDGLLKTLDLPEDRRPLLARFLTHLRRHLADVKPYGPAIQYANNLAQLGNLADISLQVSTLLADRRLTGNDEQALQEYRAFMRHRLGDLCLPLMRKRTREAVRASLKQVYVPLRLYERTPREAGQQKMTGKGRRDRLPDPRLEETRAGSVAFGDLLNRSAHFIMIGPPGCGKSTLLSRAALAFAEQRARQDLGWQGEALLPVFVRLRNFAAFLKSPPSEMNFCEPASGALIAYLDHYFRVGQRLPLSPDFFDRRLREGGCLVLLDGLDEVSSNRELVAQQITAFMADYAPRGNRFGISSRPRGYESVELLLRPENLLVVEVNPLQPAGIRQLVANLLDLIEPNPHQRTADTNRLMQAILRSAELTALAGIPLMCSALVQVYKYHGELPQRRVDVFEELVDLLLGFWRAQQQLLSNAMELAKEDGTGRSYRDLGVAVAAKRRRLSYLAWQMQETHRVEIDAGQAQAILARFFQEYERAPDLEAASNLAEGFLISSHENSGLLVENEPGLYTFLHKGFMEYLAALMLVNRSQTFVDTAVAHAGEDWWDPVLLLAGAYSKLPDDLRCELVNRFLQESEAQPYGGERWKVNLLTAGRLSRDMGDYLPGPEREAVEYVLQAAMTNADLEPKLRAEAGDVLDETGWLPPDLHDFVEVKPVGRPPFWIGKYPVTNAQYERFLQPENFADRSLWVGLSMFDEHSRLIRGRDWGEQAWDWLQDALKDSEAPLGGVLYPRYWTDSRFGIARRGVPVVGLSWYEAGAYCRWLQRAWSAQPEAAANPALHPVELRLPTEVEWVAAAWGAPGGPVTEAIEEVTWRANVDESGIRRTTPVAMYPLDASPCGAWGLGDNVWEWQANYADKDHDFLGLRGGSWVNEGWDARPAERYRYIPRLRDYNIGFRVLLARP